MASSLKLVLSLSGHPGWGFPLGYHPWLDTHLSALGYNLSLGAFNPLAHPKALELARVPEGRCLRCRGCETGGPCSRTPPTPLLSHTPTPTPTNNSTPPPPSSSASSPVTSSSSTPPSSSSLNNCGSLSNNNHINNNKVTSSGPIPTSVGSILSPSSVRGSPLGGLSAFSIPKSTPKALNFSSRESSFQPVKPSVVSRSLETKVWRPY
ncbi:hypothetical protein Avbf_14997 [Armadillidium vulgare]|nr:hypothetical protein Avbf_14997 [Armadillidium vulgare]